MNRVQAIGQQFPRHIKMAQIGPGKIPAGVAPASGVNGTGILFMAGVADINGTVGRKQLAVSRIARGQHAIKHIRAEGCQLDEVFRGADTHNVSGPVCGQQRQGKICHLQHHFSRLSNT